jgi:hypothetical protein
MECLRTAGSICHLLLSPRSEVHPGAHAVAVKTRFFLAHLREFSNCLLSAGNHAFLRDVSTSRDVFAVPPPYRTSVP